jgi:HTH-type transcriptional regulator/antitoxin HigA
MKYAIIKSKKQYKEYCNKVMDLASKKPTKEIEDELELLELLIDNWEKDNLKNDESDPIELLKFLIENHNMERSDLIKLLGISKGALSQILSYKKGLSKNVIRKLSERFKVSQEAFNRPYLIKSQANKGHKDERMMNTTKELVAA